MESVFECEFTPSIRMAANRIIHYSPGRYIFLLTMGLAVCGYMLPIAIQFRLEGIWLLYALFAVGYFAYALFWPVIQGYFSVRSYKKDIDGDGVYRIRFGDTIEIIQGTIRVSREYSEISRIQRLKYTYELMKNKRMAIMVDPKGFTKGTFEEFKQFLRTKRPDLLIPE